MTDFIESLGPAFFAHRLKRLSETLVEGVGAWMRQIGVTAPPKAASTLLLLYQQGPQTVGEIARRVRLDNALIVTLTRELEGLDLVVLERGKSDPRRRLVSLTARGERQAELIGEVHVLMATAYANLCRDAGIDGFAAVEAIENALSAKGLPERLKEATLAGLIRSKDNA